MKFRALQGQNYRCAVCHDASSGLLICQGCQTHLHAQCLVDVGSCPTLGCEERDPISTVDIPVSEKERSELLDKFTPEKFLKMIEGFRENRQHLAQVDRDYYERDRKIKMYTNAGRLCHCDVCEEGYEWSQQSPPLVDLTPLMQAVARNNLDPPLWFRAVFNGVFIAIGAVVFWIISGLVTGAAL